MTESELIGMKNKTSKLRYVLSTIAHAFIMLLAYTSPVWLDWKLIILFLALYYLQIWIFGGCILTFAQYGTYRETFTGSIIAGIASKFGVKANKEKIKKFLDILPLIFIIIALIYQVIFKMPILIKVF